MGNIPLHPAIVHLPLGLSLAMPILAAVAAWFVFRKRWPRSAWVPVAILQSVIAAAGFLAMRSGEEDEEKVEAVVAESLIEEHEELAEAFTWTATGTAVAAIAAAAVPEALAIWLMAGAVAGMAATTGLGVATGHAGGRIVFEGGACTAHAGAPGAAAGEGGANGQGVGPGDAEGPEGDEDEDD